MQKNAFDYVAGGSSRVDGNFNTLLFDSLTRSKGFNIGADGSSLCEAYLTLYVLLKNGNKIKNYLLQVEDNYLMNPKKAFTYPFHDYYFLEYIGEKEAESCFRINVPAAKYYLWKYIPYIKFAEFNNYYGVAELFNPPKVNPDIIALKGYNPHPFKARPDFPSLKYPSITNEIPADPQNIFYLDKINDLCKSHGINFIIYSSPVYPKSYSAYKPENLNKTLLDFVRERKVRYFNFMVDPQYTEDSLYYDETHLNSVGTDKFMKQLADSLRTVLKS